MAGEETDPDLPESVFEYNNTDQRANRWPRGLYDKGAATVASYLGGCRVVHDLYRLLQEGEISETVEMLEHNTSGSLSNFSTVTQQLKANPDKHYGRRLAKKPTWRWLDFQAHAIARVYLFTKHNKKFAKHFMVDEGLESPECLWKIWSLLRWQMRTKWGKKQVHNKRDKAMQEDVPPYEYLEDAGEVVEEDEDPAVEKANVERGETLPAGVVASAAATVASPRVIEIRWELCEDPDLPTHGTFSVAEFSKIENISQLRFRLARKYHLQRHRQHVHRIRYKHFDGYYKFVDDEEWLDVLKEAQRTTAEPLELRFSTIDVKEEDMANYWHNDV